MHYSHTEGRDLWVPTSSGLRVSLVDPQRESIVIEDIAYHLAMQTRFNGAAPISVAQHSVMVARCCESHLGQLVGLLHDGHEAYTGDVTRPVKDYLRRMHKHGPSHLDLLEAKIQRAVYEALLPAAYAKLVGAVLAEVKRADERVLATERRDFISCGDAWDRPLPEPLTAKIELWSATKARCEFLAVYDELLEAAAELPPAA